LLRIRHLALLVPVTIFHIYDPYAHSCCLRFIPRFFFTTATICSILNISLFKNHWEYRTNKHVIFEESIVIEISIYIWRGSSHLITLVLALDIGEIRGRCMPVR